MTADLARIEDAAALVHTVVPATPQYCWPLLSRRTGTELWVKHENHTPIGAFKLRGGLVYLDELRRIQPRRHHRDPRQSRAEHRLCRVAARSRRDNRRAARQQRRKEPGDGGLWRDA